jgi:NAD(P)-dependent dehydrogenase (short-subunit alcohol dehydrogenase family)
MPDFAKERTALITGASKGLGLALARALAKRGWNLIITARDKEQLQSARNELAQLTHVAAIAGDVTDPAHRASLAILARGHSGLDAIINNAGALGPSPQPSLMEYPLDNLENVLRTNVVAPLGVIQALKDQLKPGARVINVTSDAGVNAYAGWGGYGSSKAALEQLSAILSAENPELKVYCTRLHILARTSATALSPKREFPDSSRFSKAIFRPADMSQAMLYRQFGGSHDRCHDWSRADSTR